MLNEVIQCDHCKCDIPIGVWRLTTYDKKMVLCLGCYYNVYLPEIWEKITIANDTPIKNRWEILDLG